MPAKMTATARRQGWKNSFVIVPIVLVGIWLLERVLALSGVSDANARHVAFVVAVVLTTLVFMANWVYGRSMAGRVLLDCGPFPGKWVYLAVGLLIGVVSCWHRDSVFSIDLWFPVTLAAFFLLAAFGRLQVRENGIMTYWNLLQWNKFASYKWTDDCTLLVSKKSRSSLQAALSVPPEQKDVVDELLKKYCPKVSETT